MKEELTRLWQEYDKRVLKRAFPRKKAIRSSLLGGLVELIDELFPDEKHIGPVDPLQEKIDYDEMLRVAAETSMYKPRSSMTTSRLRNILKSQEIKRYEDLIYRFGYARDLVVSQDRIRTPKWSGLGKAGAVTLYTHLASRGIELFEQGYTEAELGKIERSRVYSLCI